MAADSQQLLVDGKARCWLMLPGWDGGPVVVRGRESRPHGEGVQHVFESPGVVGIGSTVR